MADLRFISNNDTLVCTDEIAAVEPMSDSACAIILKGSGRVIRLGVSSAEVVTMMRESVA